jgi:hypothetical protein
MRVRSAAQRAILAGIAALAILVSGCALRKGPPDPTKVQQKVASAREAERVLVDGTVGDGDRAARVIGLMAERDRAIAELTEVVVAYRERMRDLNADYDTTAEQLDATIADYNSKRLLLQTELAELIAAMKAETTAEEWKAIAKYQLKKLDPRELIYGPAGGGA